MTPEVLATFTNWFQTTLAALPPPDNPAPPPLTAVSPLPELPGWDKLKPHEQTVLRLIAEGGTTASIADTLNLSGHTIHGQRTIISRKLGLTGPDCLLRFAERHRAWLLQPPPA